MCLILVVHQPEDPIPLLVLANRDEFYDRPSAAAEYWRDSQPIVAGRDLVSGGTWFGARYGRWATVTNVREGIHQEGHSTKSRGWLVRDYLQGNMSPADYVAQIGDQRDAYAGYNLLLGDGRELWYATNRGERGRRLEPALYGLSNHFLDTPWPKVVNGKSGLRQLINRPLFDFEEAFSLLTDTSRSDDAMLPDTGVPLEWERALSAIFITMPTYGTRCSTILMTKANGQQTFLERRYKKGPDVWQESGFFWDSQGSLLDR